MKTTPGFRLRTIMDQATLIGEGIAQIDFNKLITLNASAAYLWQAVEGREFTVDELAALLAQRYGIPLDTARRDAAALAAEWLKHGVAQEDDRDDRE